MNLDQYKLVLWSNTKKKGGDVFRANPTGRNNGVTNLPTGVTLKSGESYTICHKKHNFGKNKCDYDAKIGALNHNGINQDFIELKHMDKRVDSVWDPEAKKDKTCHRTEASLKGDFFQAKPKCQRKNSYPVNKLPAPQC